MAIQPPKQIDILEVMDVTYGLVDGSTTWPALLEALIDLAGLDRCSLQLYDCGRGQIQVIEFRGLCSPMAEKPDDLSRNLDAFDDFLWRSRPGSLWRPSPPEHGRAVTDQPDSGSASSYAVVDRDRAHILYLEFSSERQGQHQDRGLDYETVDLLQSLLPHVHRACRLYRSIHGDALLTLADPRHVSARPTTGLPIELRLRRRFQLSKAEARVAKLLAEGLSPRMIADQLHVSIHTVRSQLQSIFQKTETSRQAELTSVLLRETEIPTALCRTRPADLDNRERSLCL